MKSETYITLLIITSMICISLAGFKLASEQHWIEASFIIVSLVAHVLLTDAVDVD